MLHHSDEKIAGLQHVLEHIGYKVGVSNRWSDGGLDLHFRNISSGTIL